MYGHFNSTHYDNHSSNYLSQSYPSHFSPLLSQSYVAGDNNFDSIAQLGNGNGSSNSGTSSSYIGSPSSPLSCCTSSHPPNYSTNNMIQRSLSSHSLLNNGLYPPVSSPPGFPDLDSSPVRRVSSTGDLEGINILRPQHHHERSPLGNESTSIILEGMARTCRYNPEEKRERIERYRSKRSQRNFNKKIQYVCRKTLADSRPRIRGRFARNDEIEKTNYSPDQEWNQMALAGEEDDEDDEQWIHLLDSFASNLVP